MFGLCFLGRLLNRNDGRHSCGHTAEAETQPAQAQDALSIVRERYARGEIDKVTFDRLRQDLS